MQAELLDLFEYRNGNLYWKETRCGRAVAGELAGNLEINEGYPRRRIFFRNRLQPASRLIWIMHFGEIDKGMFVDHIDGDSSNNLIENLRLLSPTENCRNNKRFRLGHTPGVRFRAKLSKWVAYTKLNGKQHHVGYFLTESDAIKALTEYRKGIENNA